MSWAITNGSITYWLDYKYDYVTFLVALELQQGVQILRRRFGVLLLVMRCIHSNTTILFDLLISQLMARNFSLEDKKRKFDFLISKIQKPNHLLC